MVIFFLKIYEMFHRTERGGMVLLRLPQFLTGSDTVASLLSLTDYSLVQIGLKAVSCKERTACSFSVTWTTWFFFD